MDVAHIAKLANLPLTDDEKDKFQSQLGSILGYVEKLKEVKTDGIKPTSQVTGLENVTRKDEAAMSFTQEEVMSGAKKQHNNLFQVEGIFKSDE